MSFFVGGAWIDAPKGSLVIAPGGTAHDFENRTAERAGALNLSVPGDFEPQMGGIAEWFRARSAAASRTANAPRSQRSSSPSRGKHGDEERFRLGSRTCGWAAAARSDACAARALRPGSHRASANEMVLWSTRRSACRRSSGLLGCAERTRSSGRCCATPCQHRFPPVRKGVARARANLSGPPLDGEKGNEFARPHAGKEIAVSDEGGAPRADVRSSAPVGDGSSQAGQGVPRGVPRARTRELRGRVAEVRRARAPRLSGMRRLLEGLPTRALHLLRP